MKDCETVLEQRLEKTAGFVILSPEPGDISLLSEMIRSEITDRHPASALKQMVATTPRALACFLAWMGKTHYTEGRFWPEILASLGLSGQRWEAIVGRAFLQCLDILGIPALRQSGSHRYVAEILFQGGIPDSCIGSFYRDVVRYFAREGLLTPEAIRVELEHLRREENEVRLAGEKAALLVSDIEQLSQRVSRLRELVSAKDELASVEARLSALPPESVYLLNPGDDLLLNWGETSRRLHANAEALAGEIVKLLARRQLAELKARRFTHEDKRLISCSDAIDRLAELWKTEDICSQKCCSIRNKMESSALREAEAFASIGALGQPAPLDTVCPPDVLESQDSALAALGAAVERRLSADAELRNKGYLASGSEQVNGHSSRIKPLKRTRWLGAIGLAAGAVILALGGYLAYQPARGPVLPFMLASAVVFGGAVLQASSAVHGAIRYRELSETWQDAVLEISGLLTLLGIPQSLAQTMGSHELSALESFFHERRVQATLSRESELEAKRLAEIRQHIDGLHGEVFEAAVRSVMAQARFAAQPWEKHAQPSPPTVCPVHSLNLALRRKRDAEAAEREMEEGMDSRLIALLRHRFMLGLLVALGTAKLRALGQGEIKSGLEVLKKIRSDQSRLVSLRRLISRLSLSLEEASSRDVQQLEHRIAQLRDKLRSVQKNAGDRSLAFPYADEPVSKYMVLGGEAAAEFLIESVALYTRFRKTARSQGKRCGHTEVEALVRSENVPLTPAQRCFSLWVSSLPDDDAVDIGQDDEGVPDRQAPYVVLRSDIRELTLVVPDQTLPLTAVLGPPFWTILADHDKVQQPAEAQRHGDELCLVRGLQIPVPVGPNQVDITLSSEGVNLDRWRLDVSWLFQAPSLFHYRTGRSLAGGVKGELVWVVLPVEWRLMSDVRLIQEDRLAGFQGQFGLRLVDIGASQLEKLVFENARGAQVVVPIELASDKDPRPVGDRARFTLEGEAVYLDALPEILMSLDREELADWTFHLFELPGVGSDETRELYCGRLSDLKGRCLQEQPPRVTIALDALTKSQEVASDGRIRQYVARLAGPRRSRWLHRFFVMKSGEVWFNPVLRVPQQGDSVGPVTACIMLPDGVGFACDDEGAVQHREEGYVETLLAEGQNALRGWLSDGFGRYAIQQPIPQALVRIEYDDHKIGWSGKSLTDWVDNLGGAKLSVLLCETENLALERVDLELGGTSQVIRKDWSLVMNCRDTSEIAGGDTVWDDRPLSSIVKVDFDLGQFVDTMRSSGTKAILYLTFYSSADGKQNQVISRAPILHVDTEWLIEDLRYDLRVQRHGSCQLSLSWRETGKAQRRSLVLWPRRAPWRPPVWVPIQEGKSSLTVDIGEVGLEPGPYRVRFVTRDLWGTDDSSAYPEAKLRNVFDLDLAPAGCSAAEIARRGDPKCTQDTAIVTSSESSLEAGSEGSLVSTLVSLEGRPQAVAIRLPFDGLGHVSQPIPNRGLSVCTMAVCPSSGFGAVVLNRRSPSIIVRVGEDDRELVLRASRVINCSLLLFVDQRIVHYVEEKPRQRSRTRGPDERTIERVSVPSDQVEEVLASLDTGATVSLPMGSRKAFLTLARDGTGRLKMGSGTKCLVCGRIFANQSAFHSHEHKRVCAADKLIPNYTIVDVSLNLEWKPFLAVEELLRREELRHLDLDSLTLIDFWPTEESASSWKELFCPGSEYALALTLLSKEFDILEGLQKMVKG